MRFKTYLALGLFLFTVVAIVAVESDFSSEVTINLFNFVYDNYDDDTTNFNSLNETEVMNARDVILENSTYGRIEFLENLNLFDMKDEFWTVDFDANLNISNNLINVDDYILNGINKSAMIYLYGITFNNPIIYNKGAVCASCAEDNYLGEVYSFTTDYLEGPYYLREGPYCGDGTCDSGEDSSSCSADCDDDSGGDTGGGDTGGDTGNDTGIVSPNDPEGDAVIIGGSIYDFSINPTLIEASIRKGSYFQKKIIVENTGNRDLTIGIYAEGVEEYVFPEIKNFIISPGETKEIRIDLYVSDDVAADAYLGKIKFASKYVLRSADIVLLVNNKDALFDIRTTVLKKYVNPGGRARANVSIINMGDLRNFDVDLEYKILDFDRNEYTVKKEQFAIDTVYSDTLFLDTPKDMPIGNYIFYSTVSYKNINATSYDTFVIERVSYFSWIILIIIILILMYLAIKWYKERKAELIELERLKMIDTKNTKKTEKKMSKLVPEEVPLLP